MISMGKPNKHGVKAVPAIFYPKQSHTLSHQELNPGFRGEKVAPTVHYNILPYFSLVF
jgi:hypothetical protein